jgi:hypothetical protein
MFWLLLPFKVRLLGHTRVQIPDDGMRFKNWYVWPIRSEKDKAQLSPRATERVEWMFNAGFKPADLLIYHPSPGVRSLENVLVWVDDAGNHLEIDRWWLGNDNLTYLILSLIITVAITAVGLFILVAIAFLRPNC